MNLTNKHSRKYEGYLNDKAIGISPDDNTVRDHSQHDTKHRTHKHQAH